VTAIPELKRTLGVFGAANIGIGAIIGAGIFVLIGVASGLAGPAVIFSFMIAGLTAFLTALSSAELSSFITESGGSYAYTKVAFGRFWGFVVGWMKSFDYVVGASAVSIGFAAYFAYFLNLPASLGLLILVSAALPIVLMLINLRGMKEASGTNNVLVVLKISALIIFMAVGAYAILAHGSFTNYNPFLPRGVGGMFSGAAIIFFAFIGFNTVTILSEEIKNPEKNVPKAIMLAFVVCTILYIGVSVVAVGLLNWQVLGISNAPLESALETATNNPLILKYVSISALFATASVVMASILGVSRVWFAMARQGVVPKSLSKISKKGVPASAIVLGGVAIALIALAAQGNLNLLASLFNFGTLLTFLFINLSVIRLRRRMPKADRKFKVPFYPIPPIMGILSCILLAYYLNLLALLFAVAWILVGIAVYDYMKGKNLSKK
jgi:APA family basic amino acid/polyamine antiporter